MSRARKSMRRAIGEKGNKMERKAYIETLRRAAMLRRGLYSLPVEVPKDCRVVYSGQEYYPDKLELGFLPDGKPVYTAVLHEIDRSAVLYVPMESVDELGKSN